MIFQVADAYVPKHPFSPATEDFEDAASQKFSTDTNFTAETIAGRDSATFGEEYADLSNRATIPQTNAPVEMTFISWAQGDPSRPNPITVMNNQYNYDDSAGFGQTVYSLDFGANLNNPVSPTQNCIPQY